MTNDYSHASDLNEDSLFESNNSSDNKKMLKTHSQRQQSTIIPVKHLQNVNDNNFFNETTGPDFIQSSNNSEYTNNFIYYNK